MQTTSPAFVNVALKSTAKLKKYNEADRQHHCEAWRKSGLSMNVYSRRVGIALSSLSKWVNVDKRSGLLQQPAASSFIKQQGVEIILVNGMRLRFAEINNMAEILKLIQVISSCN